MEILNARRRMPRPQKFCIFALCTLAVFALGNIPVFAEYVFARGITRWISFLIGRITNFIAVSFYEWTAVLLIVAGVAYAAGVILLLCKKRFARAGRWLYRLVMFGLAVLLAFGVLYAPLYNRGDLFPALGLPQVQVTEENVYAAAEYFVDMLNQTSAKLERDGEGNVVADCSFDELADILNEEYQSLGSSYFAGFEVRPKQVVLSVPMSYLGITGIYFPFYAEANVNVNIPACDLPVTMAHEMAHAKGVSMENEANLTAYVLCIRSGSDYLTYSGLMAAVSNLLNALPDESYSALRDRLSPEVLLEYRNVSEHYRQYSGIIDEISSWFNDLFLKANGIPSGTRNYGETTRGLVSLYLSLAQG